MFDCNVYLQAASRGKSLAAECLRLVEKGLVRLYLSEAVFAEVEDVLNRPEIRNHFRTLTDEVIEAVFDPISLIIASAARFEAPP